MRRALALLALLATAILIPAAPAAADDCGATASQWAAPIVGSVWTGTLTDSGGAETVVVVLTTVSNVAAVTVAEIPLAGSWSINSNQLLMSVATEGISYLFDLGTVTCSAGKVTAASGAATDGVYNIDPVSLARTV